MVSFAQVLAAARGEKRPAAGDTETKKRTRGAKAKAKPQAKAKAFATAETAAPADPDPPAAPEEPADTTGGEAKTVRPKQTSPETLAKVWEEKAG